MKIKQKAEDAAKDFKKKVDNLKENNGWLDWNVDEINEFDELERLAIHKIDEFKELQETLQKAIVTECNNMLISISSESEIPYTSLEPDFSEETFKKIKESTKEKAEETRSYETGTTFKKSHTYSAYSREKHFKIVRDSILTRLGTIKNDLIKNLVDFVINVSRQYMSELQENANAKKEELKRIYEAKLNAEQIQLVIVKLGEVSATCESYKRSAEKIKGGIEKYVQQNA